ncbi:MAG: hypothetical protein HC841_07110 [Verrucomicrobiae bacterium]|nr:hypothetical protein [Verrucomicrobiae bacterium]
MSTTSEALTIRPAGECAYEHWHRMLFARFLAENGLLIEPEENMAIKTAVSLAPPLDCCTRPCPMARANICKNPSPRSSMSFENSSGGHIGVDEVFG